MRPRTARPSFRIVPAALALSLAIACDNQLPTAPGAAAHPTFDIADASTDYKRGFYWLPPMVQQPAYAGTFDAVLSPTVEICELAGDACGPVLATYTTTTGPGGEIVRLAADEQQYHVNWHTDGFELSTAKLYRITVRAGQPETLLGYADMQPVSNGSGLKKVDTDEYIGLVDGRTLPIKFRIETGIPASVRVEPLEAEIEPGATQQFVAVVRDLHGDILSTDVSWSSSNDAVATVDETGLATAVAEGSATITATSQRINGAAVLTVDRVVGSVDVEPLEASVEPGATQQFIAIVRDRQGNIMTADVTWSSSDEAVATVDQAGLATAIDDGAATITATAEGKSGSASLTVEGGVVVIVSTGGGHACGLDADGRAFCWGRNEHGQLGDGTLINRRTPTAVAGGRTFIAIDADVFHTCALTKTGEAYCWGLNQFGEVGDGTQTRRSSPVAVLGGHTFASITTGGQNTCAITPANTAFCWGQGFFGANGTGTQTNALTPQPVAGGHSFASISAGSQYACGLTTAGQGFCWGNGGAGKLGNGSNANRLVPVAITGTLTLASISAGGAHACAVTIDGNGYCWGAGSFGRLGNGSVATHTTPQPVSGNVIFASISAGGPHTCGVSIAGQGYCWGGNIEGSLGTGSGLSRSTPGLVFGGHTWRSISAGPGATAGSGSSFASSCGVTVDDLTYCWGSNFWGQLGNGSVTPRGSPGLVAAFP